MLSSFKEAQTTKRDKRLSEMKETRLVFIQTLGLNLLVAIGKLVCGFLSSTLSMIADGFHSLLDASSNIVGIIALSIAMKPADSGHPYGHKKFEALAAMIISFILFGACLHILSEVTDRIMFGGTIPTAGLSSYIVMLITIIVNIFVTLYERKKADSLKSELLRADSYHTLSDVFVSFSVIAAILAAQFKLYWVDVASSLLITVVIFKAGYEIISHHVGSLVDAAPLEEEYIREIVLTVPHVASCHKIRSRGMPDHVFVDLHVQVAGNLTVEEGHRIASQVEEALKHKSQCIVDVMVHIEEAQN